MIRSWLTAGCAALLIFAPRSASAQEDSTAGHRPTAVAKAAFDHSRVLLQKGDTTAALAALRRAIEADPEYLAAHEQFIKLTEDKIIVRDDANFERTEALAMDTLRSQYATWMKRFPHSAAVVYGMGSVYSEAEDPRAKPYLLKAVALNPKLGVAYEDLSIDADRWGDEAGAREYMKKAAAAEPTNPNYAFYHTMDFEQVDTAQWRDSIELLAKRFPNSERGAQGLFWLASRSPDVNDQITVFEQLRTQFPPDKFGWSSDGMDGLYDIYLRTSPDKALALAQDMLRRSPEASDQRDWAVKAVAAQNIRLARALINDKKYAGALTVLSVTEMPKYSGDKEMVALMKAEAADGSGNTRAAYDSLIAIVARAPGDSTQAAIVRYGSKLDLSAAQVDSAVWVTRDSMAKQAAPFRLAAYLSHDSVSLSDYKGRILLLTFWFPGCGPCRGEFPHFQRVVNAFQSRGLAYVGINVFPEQDAYVKPFMQGTRYTFTPLRGNSKFAEDAYHVRGEPTNFLIDGSGRIVFTGFTIESVAAERMLTLMIQAMLDHASHG